MWIILKASTSRCDQRMRPCTSPLRDWSLPSAKSSSGTSLVWPAVIPARSCAQPSAGCCSVVPGTWAFLGGFIATCTGPLHLLDQHLSWRAPCQPCGALGAWSVAAADEDRQPPRSRRNPARHRYGTPRNFQTLTRACFFACPYLLYLGHSGFCSERIALPHFSLTRSHRRAAGGFYNHVSRWPGSVGTTTRHSPTIPLPAPTR